MSSVQPRQKDAKENEELAASIVLGVIACVVLYALVMLLYAFIYLFVILLAVTFSTALLMWIFWRVRNLIRNSMLRGVRRRSLTRQLGEDPEQTLAFPDRRRRLK